MKKTYQASSVEVNEISATQMICESLPLGVKGEISGNESGFEKGSRSRGNGDDNFEDLW